MKLMIVCILLLGVTNLSIQSPIAEELPDLPNEDTDDLQLAENHIFRPFFRYKERRAFRRRGPREVTPEDFNEDLPQIPDDGDLRIAENRFYKPLYRIGKIYLRRAARDVTNQDTPIDEPVRFRSRRSVNSNGDDDLETAEIHIFRPLFRYRQTAAFRKHLRSRQVNRRG